MRLCSASFPFSGPLAQLVEQVTLNHLVVGSSPTRPTKLNRPRKGAFLFGGLFQDEILRSAGQDALVPRRPRMAGSGESYTAHQIKAPPKGAFLFGGPIRHVTATFSFAGCLRD